MFAYTSLMGGRLSFINDCPVLKVTFANSVRNVVWEYVDATINISFSPTLAIYLKDLHYTLYLALHYHVYEVYDLIEYWVTLENLGETDITVERLFSISGACPKTMITSRTCSVATWTNSI